MSRPLSKQQQEELLRAAFNGNLDSIKRICGSSKDINVNQIEDGSGRTPLHLACIHGHEKIVRCLLETQRANVQCRDNREKTPLHYASFHGHLETVRYLTGRLGIDVNAINNDGDTPLHNACRHGDLEIVRCLTARPGININTKNKRGLTPLLMAERQNRTDVVDHMKSIMVDDTHDDESMHDGEKELDNQTTIQPDPTDFQIGGQNREGGTIAPTEVTSSLMELWYDRALQKGKEKPRHLRLMMSGPFGAGKSSIVRSLQGEPFDPNYISTEGISIDKRQLGPEFTFRRSFGDWFGLQDPLESLQTAENRDSLLEDTRERNLESLLPSPINSSPQHHRSTTNKKMATATATAKEPKSHPTSDVETEELNVDDKISMSIWDFAGQIDYHCMHQIFFRSNCIYLLVLDLQTDETKRQSSVENMLLDAQKWLNAIVSSAGTGIGLIVVGTHADLFETLEAAKDRLESFINILGDRVADVEWDHVLIHAPRHVVDNRHGKGIPELRRTLQDLARSLLSDMGDVPLRWLRLHERLDAINLEDNHFCLPMSRVEGIARKFGFVEKDELISALSYFDRTGDIVYIASDRLQDWVFSQPQLLLNAMRSLLAPLKESKHLTSSQQKSRQQLEEKGYLSNGALATLWNECKFKDQDGLRGVLSSSGLIMDFDHGVVVPCRTPTNDVILEKRDDELQIIVETVFSTHLPPSLFPYILAMAHHNHGLSNQKLSMISQTSCCLALESSGNSVEDEACLFQFRAKFSIQQLRHSVFIQILAAQKPGEHRPNSAVDSRDKSSLKRCLAQLCKSLIHSLHISVKERLPELSLSSWVQNVVKCNNEFHKWCILKTESKSRSVLPCNDAYVCDFGIHHTVSDAICAAKSVHSTFRYVNTDEKSLYFQPTLMLNDYGADEDVGEFSQPSTLDSSSRCCRSGMTYFFLSHTGKDKMKESVARPTHWFLRRVLNVMAFIDDGDMLAGNHKDEVLTKKVYECTHALVILSPQYRRRKYCVKELNTFMLRRARNDGIQVIPALWGIQSVDGYSPELDELCRIQHHSGSSEVDFLVQTLWPNLVQMLGRGSLRREELEMHLRSYVRETRSFRTIPSFMEVFVDRTAGSPEKGKEADSATKAVPVVGKRNVDPLDPMFAGPRADTARHDEGNAACGCTGVPPTKQLHNGKKPGFNNVGNVAAFGQIGGTDRILKKAPFVKTLIFHCVRDSNRMDIILPVSDVITLQDLYDELGKEDNRMMMRRFPKDYKDIKAGKKKIQLECRTRSSGEAFLVSDLKNLHLMSTEQVWEHNNLQIWVNVVVVKVPVFDDEEDMCI